MAKRWYGAIFFDLTAADNWRLLYTLREYAVAKTALAADFNSFYLVVFEADEKALTDIAKAFEAVDPAFQINALDSASPNLPPLYPRSRAAFE